MVAVSISLPESLKSFMESQITGRGLGNVSEVCSLLGEAQAKEYDDRL